MKIEIPRDQLHEQDLFTIMHTVSGEIAERIVENMPHDPRALVSPQMRIKKVQFEQEANLRLFTDRIKQGLEALLPVVDALGNFETQFFTQEALLGIKKLSQEVIKLQKIALQSVIGIDEEKSVQELMELSDVTKQALFRAAIEIYNLGRYNEAAAALSIVTLLDPFHYDGWVAQGCAEYHCKRFAAALIAFAMAVMVNPAKPQSHFYAAHCYEALKQYDFALNSLDLALIVINENPEYLELAKKAEEHKQHMHELAASDHLKIAE